MSSLDSAEQFVLGEARLLERLRFAHHFRDASPQPVITALTAFRNPDGGFGNALEPDLRCAASQPVATQTAIEILQSCGTAPDHELIPPMLDFFASIQRPDGGIPFALPSAMQAPHAPWWVFEDSSSLTQTAANCAALHGIGATGPALDSMSEFCRRQIESLDLAALEVGPAAAYDLRFAVAFLNQTPAVERAGALLDRLIPALLDSPFMSGEGQPAELLSPLALAPLPESRSRALIPDDLIEADLDRLATAQENDGGWDIPWAKWSTMATAEWRGVVTLDAVSTLKAHGRL